MDMIITTMCVNKDDFILNDIKNTLEYIIKRKNSNYLKKPIYQRYLNYTELDFIFSKYKLQYVTEKKLYEKISQVGDIIFTNYVIYKKVIDE